jgi:hypothetical protein
LKRFLVGLALAPVVLNYFWFMGESAWLGGIALSGYQRDGECFIGNHGAYRQVACAAWQWNRLHAASVFVFTPIAVVGVVVYGLLISLRNPAANAQAATVLASGSVLAVGNTRGSVQKGTLRVAVYPAGIVITAYFMAPVVIRTSDIHSLQVKPWYFGRKHMGIMVNSPAMMWTLTLYQSPEGEIGRAIELITGKRFALPLWTSASFPSHYH